MKTPDLTIALMSSQATAALMAAQALPAPAEGVDVPEWIHLLPAGAIGTTDARGPYSVDDVKAVIEASFAVQSRLPIDENHATDLAAPNGAPAPARGWIVAMEPRADGIWGQVEWNAAGHELVSTKAYRGISPVILHDEEKQVHSILRAALTNDPNLRGLTALHQKQEPKTMNWSTFLADLLGLPATATEEEVKAALRKGLKANNGKPAAQSAMAAIGKAVGLKDDVSPEELVTAVQTALAASADNGTILALQSALTETAGELETLKTSINAKDAAAFVDDAIAKCRIGVKPQRERFIAMHQKDPAGTEELINCLPCLNGTQTALVPPAPKEGEIALNSAEANAARLLGMSKEEMAASRDDLASREVS